MKTPRPIPLAYDRPLPRPQAPPRPIECKHASALPGGIWMVPSPEPLSQAALKRIEEMMKRRIPGTGAVVLEDTRDLSTLDPLAGSQSSGRSSQRYVTWM